MSEHKMVGVKKRRRCSQCKKRWAMRVLTLCSPCWDHMERDAAAWRKINDGIAELVALAQTPR